MAITFPKTWSNGETLTASDTKNNLDAMRDKAQKLVAGDVNTASAWINTHHIMQPSYNSVTNVSSAVSGVFGGQNNGSSFHNMSYVTRWMSSRTSTPTTPQVIFVPLTCVQVDLTAPCTLFIQWYMNHLSPDDADGLTGQTQFFAYHRSGSIQDGFSHKVPAKPNGSGNSAFLEGCYQTNGSLIVNAVGSTGTSNLNYGIGVKAKSTVGRCVQIAWSVSIECFYM